MNCNDELTPEQIEESRKWTEIERKTLLKVMNRRLWKRYEEFLKTRETDD